MLAMVMVNMKEMTMLRMSRWIRTSMRMMIWMTSRMGWAFSEYQQVLSLQVL